MDNLEEFVTSVNKTINDMNILIAINSGTNTITLKDKNKHIKMFPSEYKNEGFALNTLVQEVQTPYVLIARGVEFLNNDSRLERLVRELESLNVVAVGGAFRLPNGHWFKGCFQSIYKNYILKYIAGYDESFHECLYCDYIQGPFLTTTTYLKSNLFGDFDENNGLFEDFFLRLSKMKHETVVCPDSMFHVKNTYDINQEAMVDFLQKWNLFEMLLPSGRTINRNCKAKTSRGKSFALSFCFLRANNNAVKDIMQICVDAGITCEVREGTALGAVKFGSPLPWELDFDIGVLFDNCSKCHRLEHLFLKSNIIFNNFASNCCAKKIKFGDELEFKVLIRGYRGDLTSLSALSSDELVNDVLQQTKVFFGGQWLNIAWNPGLYMRNRYGVEMYRHAEHWSFTDMKETQRNKMNYTSGRFYPCEEPGAHNCLDSYNADGNLLFKELFP